MGEESLDRTMFGELFFYFSANHNSFLRKKGKDFVKFIWFDEYYTKNNFLLSI
jgi:hypothetical protein